MRAQCSKFEIPIFQGSAVVLQHLHLPAAVAQFSTSSLSLPPAEDAMSTVNLADLYCKGVRVWVPDRDQVWVGGEVVSVQEERRSMEVRVEGEEEENRVIGAKDPLPLLRNPQMLVGANDLTTLSYLHEPAVLHNLSVRFLHSQMIYTYCGIVLVALNPYQPLPIYGNETAAAYRGRDMGEMDPHIFAVAEEAFRKMTREGRDQSLIISGESGAGKTMSAKFVMRYFATVGGASTETQIERKVLASNPIMEAIGNAKTTRNDNSSRFGKYIEIRFDQKNRITGAHMRTYLLERSRVVTQATSERNYHIFYQLCAARDHPDMAAYHLGPPESFHYTSQGDSVAINGVDDQSEFTATTEAMKLLGFHNDQLGGVFRVLSAVLHLGNVEIGRRNKGGEVMGEVGEGDESLVTSTTLLGVDPAHLAHWLCHRKITTSREVYHKPLTHAQSLTARDSLAKSLYSRLFDWIVNIINSTLSSSSSSSSSHSSFIGVLDIYGFEVFQENNFEQFCINYANEKLQQQFNMHVFQLEQAEYMKEEIEWSFIDYYDNQPCIDLIENRLGILDLLDETCKMPGGCDSLFIQKLYDNHNTPSSTHFTKPRTSRSEFTIRHYAGPVQYQTLGFVDKNSEQVAEEYLLLLSGSNVPFLSSLYKPTEATPTPMTSSTGGRRRNGMRTVARVTVGSQFRGSLSGLMTTLNSTTPHYVRCIKSNDRKLPFVFDPQRAVQQLRACGVLETVRLSAAGYPSRWTYNEFFQRYRLLLSSGQVRREEVRLMCEYILRIRIQDTSQYRFGKTKLFFRAGQVAYLERLRSQRLHTASLCIQRHARGWQARQWYRRLRTGTVFTQARVRGLLARRLAVSMRRTRAVVCLQRHTRGLVARLHYQRLRRAVITTQALFRGRQARKRCIALLYDQRAVVLQKYVRGWLARVNYKRDKQRVVLTQCCVRRWAARRERRKLRMEARSAVHLHGLNKGLEMKIIELQLRLDEGERQRMAAQDLWNNEKINYEQALCEARQKIERLESELETVRRKDAHTAIETQAADPNLEPWNERVAPHQDAGQSESESVGSGQCSMEHNHNGLQKQKDPLESNHGGVEPQSNEENHSGLERSYNGFDQQKEGGTNRQEMEREIERLQQALLESEAECGRLARQVANLQQEFDSEDPTPSSLPTAPTINNADCCQAPGRDPGKSPSSSTGSPVIADVSSILILPPLPPHTLPPHLPHNNGPYSSTPADVNYLGTRPSIPPTGITVIKRMGQQERGQEHRKLVHGGAKLRQIGENMEGGEEEGGEANKTAENSESVMSSYVYVTPSYLTVDDSEEAECLKEVLEQLERERRYLMLGNREISQELNKLDATNTKTVSTLRKLARENSLLRRDLATVEEREEGSRRDMERSEGRVEVLTSKVTMLKLALQQASAASSMNASLQQEVTRLTGDNLSLMETLEDMGKTERSGYRTPMSPRRRNTPCGADSPQRNSSAKRHVSFSDHAPSLSLSSSRQPKWSRPQQSKLVKELVLELTPERVSGKVPYLPAHIIHVALRYCRHVTGSCGQAMGFLDEVTSALQQVVQAGSSHFSLLSFWLSNITHLLSLLLKTSQTGLKQGSRAALTSDLSARVDKLEGVSQATYRDLLQLIHNKIQPLIVPGLLECDSIPNITSVRPILGAHAGSHNPNITVATIIRELSAILKVLQAHSHPQEVVTAIMNQIFYTINAFLLNNLLLRRDMCHWSKGIQIRYNLSQLEDWARGNGLGGTEVLSQLLPSVEAAKLLQMKKSTAKDAESICDLCTHLNPLQVQKLLTMYSPANEFEERVPASVIRLVAQKNGADLTDPAHLMASIDCIFPVAFPHSPPADISYRNISLPPSLNHLDYLLTTAH